MAEADQIQISYVEESTFGVTPESNLQIIRVTGEDLGGDIDTAESAEITGDRQKSRVARTGVAASGSVNVELSYGTFDDWLAAALLAAEWSSETTVLSAGTASAAESGNKFTHTVAWTATPSAGQWIEVRGFTTAGNNGYFKVASASSTEIVVEGGTLADEASVEGVTITQAAQIVNGTTKTSFAIEKLYSDLAGTVISMLHGMMIDTMDVSISADAYINGTFNFIGKNESSEESSEGSGYTAATTEDAMAAVDDVVAIYENMSSVQLIELSFSLGNNLRPKNVIGTAGPIGINAGSITLTGTVQMYFESATVLNKFIDFTSSRLAVVTEDTDGNAVIFEFPEIKYTSGRRVAGGQNTDIIADLGFTAYEDPTENVTIRIAKFAA